jgi:hypothetical protein
VRGRSEDRSVARLIEWIRAAGGRVGPLRVGPSGGGQGVFAAAAIEEGELLLELPNACLLTTERAAETAAGRTIAAEWRGPSHDQILLAALLVARDDPARAAYRESLPTRLPSLPLYYTPAEAEALLCTSLGPRMRERHLQIGEEVAWLRGNAAGMAALGEVEWFFARAQVGSRCFYLGELHGEAMVPFADLLNHASQPDTRWQLDARGSFVLRAVRPLPAGAELHHSYGEISNARLLLNYGFTQADNSVRVCLLELPGCGELTLAEVDAEALQGVRARVGEDADRRLRAACAERLGELPELVAEDAGAAGNLGDLRRVVADERAVLSAWLAALG